MALPSGNPYVPSAVGGAASTGQNWVAQVWDNEIDRAPYQRAKVLPLITTKKPLLGKLHVPKHANLTTTTVSNTADLSGLSLPFASNTEDEFTATPASVTLNVSVNENQLVRMSIDPEDTLKTSIEMSMAAKVDSDLCSLFPVFTTNVDGSYAAPVDKSAFLSNWSKVKNGAGEYADNGMVFVYHTLVEDSVFNIDAFVSASFRGVTSKSPATDGIIPTSFGVKFVPCGNVNTSAGGYANAIFVSRAMAISFNKRATVKTQDFGHATWLLSLMDYGYGTVRDGLAGLLKSA